MKEELSQYEQEEAERAADRKKRLAEVGTEEPCPFCGRPRVTRSSYIRCNICGVNWGMDDDFSRDPRGQDRERMKATRSTETEPDGGALAVKSHSKKKS